MRLPYAPKTASSPSDAAIYDAITERRHPRPLQALDLTLLHSPPVASGWNSFLGAVRTQTTLSAGLREAVICRVAVLNGAAYEWEHHAPLAASGGISEQGLETVRQAEALRPGGSVVDRHGRGLEDLIWAALDVADQMTRHIRVDDAVFERLKGLLAEREVVEVVSTVSAYNCVSRFLVALDVGEGNERTIGAVDVSDH